MIFYCVFSLLLWTLKTLNALPAHLVTPFNGPIPPSNLLDKIARGVAERKGPAEWPHSIRATRVKIIELCRLRAAEDALLDHQRKLVADENEDIYCLDSDNNSIGLAKQAMGIRRTLHRQSSMDFINTSAINVKDNDNISRYVSPIISSSICFPFPPFLN